MREKIIGMLTCVLLVTSFAVLPITTNVDSIDLGEYMYFQMPDPMGWDVNATQSNIMAEDFECTLTGLIVGIALWGSWENDEVGTITNFHLSLHEDIPVDTTATPPILYSRPGIQLWDFDTGPVVADEAYSGLQGWYDPSVPEWEYDNHNLYFLYEITIPDTVAYPQVFGTIYWLDVQVTTVDGNWGWKTTNAQVRDDAVYGTWDSALPDDPNSIDWHELIEPEAPFDSLDMAFGLITKALPPPIVTADISISPGTLNVRSNGRWVTANVQLPEGYDVRDIELDSLALNGVIPADWGKVTGKKLIVKFDRLEVEDTHQVHIELLALELSGNVGGLKFQGSDTIKVINPGHPNLSDYIDIDGDSEFETIVEDPNLGPSQSYTQDSDSDGDPDTIIVGMSGVTRSTDTDVDNDGELEIVLEDPNLHPSLSYTIDLDGDGDPDIVVTGTG